MALPRVEDLSKSGLLAIIRAAGLEKMVPEKDLAVIVLAEIHDRMVSAGAGSLHWKDKACAVAGLGREATRKRNALAEKGLACAYRYKKLKERGTAIRRELEEKYGPVPELGRVFKGGE